MRWCVPRSRAGRPASIPSAPPNGTPVYIESTSNQVNQSGGYTGMAPADFAAFVRETARDLGFPPERIVLGGDHLGPNIWQDRDAETAMAHARGLVRACVRAGYTKIHLDASMRGRRLALRPQIQLQRPVRYYWPRPEVQKAFNRLLANLTEHPPSLTILSQYLPVQYTAVREGRIAQRPVDLIHHKIMEITAHYAAACSAGHTSSDGGSGPASLASA